MRQQTFRMAYVGLLREIRRKRMSAYLARTTSRSMIGLSSWSSVKFLLSSSSSTYSCRLSTSSTDRHIRGTAKLCVQREIVAATHKERESNRSNISWHSSSGSTDLMEVSYRMPRHRLGMLTKYPADGFEHGDSVVSIVLDRRRRSWLGLHEKGRWAVRFTKGSFLTPPE